MRKTMFLCAWGAGLMLAIPVLATPIVVVNDSWADGGRDNGADPLDSNWWTSASSQGIEVSVGSLGMVTGTSGRGIHTIFPTQALLNVLHGRYEVVPDEVRNMALGMWGRTPGPVDPDVLDKIAKGEEPITVRPGSLIPPTVERVRKELGSGVSDEDLLLSLFFMPQVLTDLKDAGPIRLDDPLKGSDLVELIRAVAAGGKVKSFSLVQPA